MTKLRVLFSFSILCFLYSSTTTMAQAQIEKFDYDHQENWIYSSGNMQSPINIETKVAKKMTSDSGRIIVNYNKNINNAENNGHSIQVTDSGEALINGRYFDLSQFHFHAESEHAIDGQHFPLEVHFVNTSQSGRVAVIGVFFTLGKPNLGFQEVLDNVNSSKNDQISDIETLLPENKSYYHYLGSLTTPPLVENVEWYIMKNPVEISKEQLKQFKKFYSHNNRNLQPLNNRIILNYDQ